MDGPDITRSEYEPLDYLEARSTYELNSLQEPVVGSPVSSLTPDGDTVDLSAHHDFKIHAPSTPAQSAHHVEHEQTRLSMEKTTTSTSESLMSKSNSATARRHAQSGVWGISWYYPSYMVLWWLAGLAFALGHHFYYMSLDGAVAGSASRQGWAVRFGTAFAFLVVTCLRASSEIAYKQYIWTLCKRKAYKLDALDKLFSATTDPTALLSRTWLKDTKLAFLVVLICWCTALAGITPPATLSVTTGFVNETRSTPLRSFDWTSPQFFEWGFGIPQPSVETLRIAQLSAYSMAVVPPDPPALNTSYEVQFFGPSVQCSYANSSQQAIFDAYSQALGEDLTFTRSVWESRNVTGDDTDHAGIIPSMSVYSAFSPYSGSFGWHQVGNPKKWGWIAPITLDYSVDAYNNWVTPFYPNMTNIHPIPDMYGAMPFVNQQLWVQLADRAMVCLMVNASFDVSYEFVQGTLTVAKYQLSNLEPFWVPQSGIFEINALYEGIVDTPQVFSSFNSYMSVYLAFSGVVNGNVSTTLYDEVINQQYDGNVTMSDASSKVLQNGLSACREFTNGYWSGDNAIGTGADGPVFWRNAQSIPGVPSSPFSKINNKLFTKPSWMCRNESLIRAIEDLANNITISMLSSVNLTTPDASTTDVLYFMTHNIYQYDSQNLILSYSIALALTLACVCVGFFALHFNGVVHSVSFSAFVATTRNPELDELVSGQSLAAMPLKYPETKLRFGELSGPAGRTRGDGNEMVTGRHIGFGTVDNVTTLRRGQPYT